MRNGRTRVGRMTSPWIVLVLALAVTSLGTWLLERAIATRERGLFEHEAAAARARIEARMRTNIALLRGAAGLFAAAMSPGDREIVTRDEFHRFVSRLGLDEHYPGIQGIGFTRRFDAGELEAVKAWMREQGRPGFHVWPDHARAEYHAILYLEPEDRRNEAAIGYDMFTEPTRRAAMERARDAGETAASGRVKLVQEIEGPPQSGFLLYTPVYASAGVPETVAERRTLLLGFVYSPYRADDLFEGIFPGGHPLVALEVFDGAPEPSRRLHASRTLPPHPKFSLDTPIDIAGQTWTVRFTSRPALEEGYGRALLFAFAGAGVMLSVTLFWIALREAQYRLHAEEEHEQARAQYETLERILAVLGHDLRNPLAAIIMSASRLERRSAGSPDAKSIATIARSAERMNRLISQLVDFTRIRQTNSLPVIIQAADLTEIAKQVVEELRAAYPTRTIELFARGDTHAACDADRIGEVLSNLVGNAVQHGDAGPVTVRVRGDDSARVVVEVHNVGPPIPAEVLPEIFEPFRRGAAGASSSKSVGLGLYITREIVLAHRGTIDVRSPDEGGTTFVVTLPKCQGTPDPSRSTTTSPESAAS